MKYRSLCVALFMMCVSKVSYADSSPPSGTSQVHWRCMQDDLNTVSAMRARNAWAFKCGYVSPDDMKWLDAHEEYIIFSSYRAPADSDAPCISGMHVLAFYLKGCFTASQRVLFSDGYIPIEQASVSHQKNLITLSSGSTLEKLHFKESEIDYFVAGDNDNQDTVVLTSEHGNVLEVTKNHPMVYADGNIVRADEIKEGDVLLTADGPSVVTAIQYRPYHGKVWNLHTYAKDVESNINVAEGFLTGSVRFQNEWSDAEHCLMLRRRLSIERI